MISPGTPHFEPSGISTVMYLCICSSVTLFGSRNIPPKPARDAFAVVERHVLFAALVAVVARVGDLALARRVPRPARADGEGDDRAGEGAQRAEGGEAAGRHDCTSPRSSASVACQFASASISSLARLTSLRRWQSLMESSARCASTAPASIALRSTAFSGLRRSGW